MNNIKPYNRLRWIARISGILIVAVTLIFIIGETLDSQQRNGGTLLASYSAIILTIFFVWGIALAGLVIALWREGLGGIISLVGFILVYILNLFNKEASMRADAIVVFILFSIPSILYLVYWKLNKDELKTT